MREVVGPHGRSRGGRVVTDRKQPLPGTVTVAGQPLQPTGAGPVGIDRVQERAGRAATDLRQCSLGEFSGAPERRQRRWSR